MEQKSMFTASEAKLLMRGIKRPKKQKEEQLQMKVCKYISDNYPDAIFTCDLASGMRLPIHIAAKHKKMRSSRGFPDLLLPEPAIINNIRYSGLFIEIKQENVRLKDGGIARSPHHTEQAEMLARLNQKGYFATFCCGIIECKDVIDNYMKSLVK